ncbi:lamin tail domain-containing protein [Ferdinandcohnia sp. Marseille-Q9671]
MRVGKRVRNKGKRVFTYFLILSIFVSNVILALPTTVVLAESTSSSEQTTKEQPTGETTVDEPTSENEEKTTDGTIEDSTEDTTPTEPQTESSISETQQDESILETPPSEPTSSDPINQQEGEVESTNFEEQTQYSEVPEEEPTESIEVDFDLLPPLLITEIMPNNTGADNYEYFEVYNNTNQPINLDHYTFSLRYTDGSGKQDVDMEFSPVTLAPKSTIVFWNNVANKTATDFNSFYTTNITEDNLVNYSGPPSFYNSGNRAVVVKDPQDNEVVWANYVLEDIGDGLVVQYTYPETGREMGKLAQKAQPTPGTFENEQVPAEEVKVEASESPTITHTPVTEANALENLVIQAQITDSNSNVRAHLYYQTSENTSFEKAVMSKKEGQLYEAVIPKEKVSSDTLRYYVTATTPHHRVSYPENQEVEVSIQREEEDFDHLPQLLIPEISPNSAGGGTDYYEYFELYNNTNQPISLTNYSFIYRYTDTGNELPFQIPVTTIEPQETLVFWFNNGDRTLAEFNANFGLELVNEQVVQFKDGFPGFANGGNRALVVKDNTGAEVISAGYLANETDNNGKVVQYTYPSTGTEMVKRQVVAEPTPGSILEGQVPSTPVNLPEAPTDTEAPVITHTPVTSSHAFTPIKIEATVTDNQAVPFVTLFYKADDAESFTSLVMNPTVADGTTYSTEIPAADVEKNVTYYIQATDGTNPVATEKYIVQVEQPDVDFSQIPKFLVTEVVPDSTNVGTADGYEFIEIYNNSDKAINFKDYKMYYRYGTDAGTDVVWPSVPEDVVIPAGETLVFWIINDQNMEQTVADFNANYGSNLVENEDIVRIYSGGMANGSMRGLVIGTNTHKEITVAYYNDEPNVDDTVADKGIVYSYPMDKSTQQIKVGIMDATPGKVESFQVPAQPIQIDEDTVAPSIENLTSVSKVDQKDDIHIVANAQDDTQITSVRLFYKMNNQSEYQEAIIQEDYNDMLYHHTIYSPDLIGNQNVDYYFVVSDGHQEVESDHYRVTITNDLDQSSLRVNVKDDDILNGEKVLKATSEEDAPENLDLVIDGQEITDSTYHSVERTAYFAFEVNGLNTYFQNAVTMGEEILYVMDDDWLTQWKTFSIPIESNRLESQTTITVRSGNKASPFDLDSLENRDDYDLRNVRLVLSDGTVIKDPSYSNASQVLKMNDANPFVDFTFQITNEQARSKTYKWDTSAVVDGEHEIKVRDSDEEITKKVVVDNTAPTISSTITDGKEYKGPFSIDVTVTDELADVESVQVKLDDTEITVPYETSSAKLAPGEHKLSIVAVDKVGNTEEVIQHFSVVNENPQKPEAIQPETPVEGDPTLQVKVSDTAGDNMDVTFYQGYQYDASHTDRVNGFKNATDVEPPQEMAPAGEQGFSAEDISLVSEQDGSYLVTDSSTQFPYHRFDVTVDEAVDKNDIVELSWNGNSLEGRKVSMYAWNHNTADWELIDYKIAGTEDFELKGTVSVSDFLKESKINVLVQDEIPSSPEEYDYTFVWMSDTQYYAESFPYIFDRQTQWIAEKQEELNIEYVFHTGDLVNISTDEQQWNHADTYMKVLDDNEIPYGVLAGNHDVNQVNNDYTDYYRYFGEDRFKDKPYYGGSYLNNRGHYDLLSVDGNDYIMVYLGWGVTDEGIQWMNDVLEAHPDRMAILNFHEYLLATGTRHPLGEKLYNEVVVPNENVIAVLSGHYHEAQTLVDEIDDDGDGIADRQVTQMLADYQAGPEGGQGYMRLLHFDRDNNRILVNTYSPHLDDYNYYDTDAYPGKDEFIINLDLEPSEKRVATDYFAVNVYSDTVIGIDEDVQSGDIAETVWKGLEPGKVYSWYAVAEDGFTGRTVSDIFTFTKGEDVQQPIPNPNPDPGTEPGTNPEPTPGTEPEPSPGTDPAPDPVVEESPEQPQDDSNTDDKAKETTGEKDSTDSKLPITATNTFNVLLFGLLLMLVGVSFLLYQKHRQKLYS